MLKIDHFAFEVSDLQASIRFYEENLGFKTETTFVDENEHETLAVLGTEGGKLELIQVLDEHNQPQPFEPQHIRKHFCPHIALETDNFDEFLAKVRVKKIKLIHGPLEIPRLVKWLYLCDPDDNVIEIFQLFSTQED